MATTISGTTVTFTDGSTWGGANGTLTPDTNTSRTSQSYNIGHLILANTIFNANGSGYTSGSFWLYALNMTNQGYYSAGLGFPAGTYSQVPKVNTLLPADDSRHGSQSYFIIGGTGDLAGSWRARGMACGAGINQINGFFVLLERVA
jgi:hypothetical protein